MLKFFKTTGALMREVAASSKPANAKQNTSCSTQSTTRTTASFVPVTSAASALYTNERNGMSVTPNY